MNLSNQPSFHPLVYFHIVNLHVHLDDHFDIFVTPFGKQFLGGDFFLLSFVRQFLTTSSTSRPPSWSVFHNQPPQLNSLLLHGTLSLAAVDGLCLRRPVLDGQYS